MLIIGENSNQDLTKENIYDLFLKMYKILEESNTPSEWAKSADKAMEFIKGESNK